MSYTSVEGSACEYTVSRNRKKAKKGKMVPKNDRKMENRPKIRPKWLKMAQTATAK
jgi:hypothetical protein